MRMAHSGAIQGEGALLVRNHGHATLFSAGRPVLFSTIDLAAYLGRSLEKVDGYQDVKQLQLAQIALLCVALSATKFARCL